MSEQDSFINEVSEEVRRDKLFAAMRRYGWIAVLLIVLLVGGAAFNEWRKATALAEARAAGDAIRAALDEADDAARIDALGSIEVESDAARAAVLELLTAGAEASAGRAEDAVARLDALAGDAGAEQTYRDLATLKAVIVGQELLAPEARIERLGPLTLAGNPWRLLALEQIALAQIESGQADAALDTLREILSDATVTQGLRRRASQLIVALGGSLTSG